MEAVGYFPGKELQGTTCVIKRFSSDPIADSISGTRGYYLKSGIFTLQASSVYKINLSDKRHQFEDIPGIRLQVGIH
ncbi:hypothetical protein D3C72_2323330 [compost metagenome]